MVPYTYVYNLGEACPDREPFVDIPADLWKTGDLV